MAQGKIRGKIRVVRGIEMKLHDIEILIEKSTADEFLEIHNKIEGIQKDVLLIRKYLGFKNTEELWEAVNGEESK